MPTGRKIRLKNVKVVDGSKVIRVHKYHSVSARLRSKSNASGSQRMNRNLIDAMWNAMKSRHVEEARLLSQSQSDDLTHFENLLAAMDKRYALLSQLPDENLALEEQLPMMMRDRAGNVIYPPYPPQ